MSGVLPIASGIKTAEHLGRDGISSDVPLLLQLRTIRVTRSVPLIAAVLVAIIVQADAPHKVLIWVFPARRFRFVQDNSIKASGVRRQSVSISAIAQIQILGATAPMAAT
jgi:hypothetical protein